MGDALILDKLMKQSIVQSGPSDYIERPLRPTWGEVDREIEVSSLDEGLTFRTPLDGEDPRYAREITPRPGTE